MEEKRGAVWHEVEILTGTKFLYLEAVPLTHGCFSKVTNELDYRMMQELWMDDDMSPDKYLWKVEMSHMCLC